MTKEQEAIERINNDIAKTLYCGNITICNIDDLKTILSMLEEKAIKYYQNKDISFSVDFDTKKLLEALEITEEDSFENHQIRFKTLLNLIEKLQKENEELKVIKSLIQTLELNQAQEDKYILITKRDFLSGSYKKLLDDYIPKQKIKDKMYLSSEKWTIL